MLNIKTRVLVTGPCNKLSGGQATHISNIYKAFDGDNKFSIKFFPVSFVKSGILLRFLSFFKFIKSFFYYFFCLFYSDVIHINTTLDNKSILRDFLFISLAVLFSKRLLIQIHGGWFSRVSLFRNFFFKYLYERFFLYSSCVFVLTREQRDSIHHNFGILARQVKNYVDLPKNVDVKEFMDSSVDFLFVGRVEKDKGIFELVDACSKMKCQGLEFHLKIVGIGTEISKLREIVIESKIQDSVSFFGNIDREKVKETMRSSDVLVLPSYHEGLPYSILEALSHGLPVISTPVGAIPDVLQDGKDSLLCKIGDSESLKDCMVQFYEPNILFYMSQNAVSKSSNFSLTEMKKLLAESWGSVG